MKAVFSFFAQLYVFYSLNMFPDAQSVDAVQVSVDSWSDPDGSKLAGRLSEASFLDTVVDWVIG